MKLLTEIDATKARGGYYTPPQLVEHCLATIRRMHGGWPKSWLEPSAGDGAFLRGLRECIHADDRDGISVQAIELVEEEAHKCERERRKAGLSGQTVRGSFFRWSDSHDGLFDAVVGNPPYVRYQFVGADDRFAAERLVQELGITLRGVSNLWIPFALISLSRLKPGGCFSMVLPSELVATSSGGQFRKFLVQQFKNIEIHLFPKGTFPKILQDVVVVNGVKASSAADTRTVRFSEFRNDNITKWTHRVDADERAWTCYLLTPEEYDAFNCAKSLKCVHRLGSISRIEVAIVTGANGFFTVSDQTSTEFSLRRWAKPLLPKTADAPGVIFSEYDHVTLRKNGSRAWLLDFSANLPDPAHDKQASKYLAHGEVKALPSRYKCRIRSPWYRVPHIKRGTLMLTKRAHHYHRLILNEAGVYTTDTVYRGEMLPIFSDRDRDLVATFQNTLTLLSTEIEGRTYGGGVLELVPSEISRLAVPLIDSGLLIEEIDQLSRASSGQRDATHRVMRRVDEALLDKVPGYAELLPLLDSGRRRLQERRIAPAGRDA